MERITYRKTLDVHKSGIQFTLQGFQTADRTSRRIEISLMASGDTIDLPLEQMVALMYVTTPNAMIPSINECTIKDNTIIYDVLPIGAEGITEMQLKLIDTRVTGANKVLATPKFAVEATDSNTNDDAAMQTPTYTALENAIASAKSVYDERFLRIELDADCMFRAYYADGTIYESDVLKELFLKGDALVSQSYAKGGTGIRAGEDTDNSMYYSNVSKSASADVNRISGEAKELLQEVTKHGVYTAFSFNFEKGELEYVSPMYKFEIDIETGKLIAIGETYTFEETIELLTKGYIDTHTAKYDENFEKLNNDVSSLGSEIDTEKDNISALSSALEETNENLKTTNDNVSALSTTLEETNMGLESANENIVALEELVAELPIANGGTGAKNVETARLNLGVAPAIESTDYPGCYYRTVGDELEWLNPPMQQGVEYRTTERIHGYPVYTQLFKINSGVIGDGETEILDDLGVDGLVFRSEAWTSKRVLPYNVRSTTGYQTFNMSLDGSWSYHQGASVTKDNLWIQAWYYKKLES